MPYKLTGRSDDVAYLYCFGHMTTQHAHDFLAELYYSTNLYKKKFFIRDCLDVTSLDVDPDIPTYAAVFESSARAVLQAPMFLAILAQGEIKPMLDQYIEVLIQQMPNSVVKLCDDMAEANEWIRHCQLKK